MKFVPCEYCGRARKPDDTSCVGCGAAYSPVPDDETRGPLFGSDPAKDTVPMVLVS